MFLESLEHNVNSRETVVLSCVAILGLPVTNSNSSYNSNATYDPRDFNPGGKPVPPSVLVGGVLTREEGKKSPFLVVYGLSPNAIHMVSNDDKFLNENSEEVYISSQSTGMLNN